jgi:hypothetical protein
MELGRQAFDPRAAGDAAQTVQATMPLLCESITDFEAGRKWLSARRYGIIETAGGRLQAIHLRPWPKLVAWPEILPLGPRYHAGGSADRCLLYYNQPWRMPSFLALKYIVSTAGTSYRTFRAALVVLDAVAELKHSDAIVCDAANVRLTDRLMARLGWEAHKPQRWHRNFIRRFYGAYPSYRCQEGIDAEPQALLATDGKAIAVSASK